jgi:dihydropyrimidinase
MFGMYPEKGTLLPDTDADIVIINPLSYTMIDKDYIRGASDYSCYEGMQLSGKIEKVFLRGREIVSEGEFLGKRGDGRYLRRGTSTLAQDHTPETLEFSEMI